jgi:energy-coupling factor transporter ATP-binding protein EcfA2
MFLRSLELENIRSIQRLELDFGSGEEGVRRWTLFIGQNGTGKSTILRSIGLIASGSDALFELLGEPASWLRKGAKRGAIRAQFETAEGERRAVALEFHEQQSRKDMVLANREHLENLDQALIYSKRNYFAIGYGASRRFVASAGAKMAQPQIFTHPRARSLATLFHPGAVLHPLDAWIIERHYQDGEAGLAGARKVLSGLLPNIRLSRVDRSAMRVLFETPDGEVPLEQLSDGYQNAAGWVGDLIYNVQSIFSNFADPLSARGLLLIDELDLHLHPLWQRTLRSFLDERLPNFQIVATTHSPLSVQQAGAGELFALRRDARKKLRVEPFAGAPNRMLIHQLLLDPMFELNTSDSFEVETKRRDLRKLKTKKAPTAKDKTKIAGLRKELAEVPDFLAHTPADQGQVALLERLAAALDRVGVKGPR